MMQATTAYNGFRMNDGRGSEILARSIFRELKTNDYSRDQILAVAGELISLVTDDLAPIQAIEHADTD